MSKKHIINLSVSAMLMALGMVLPFLTGQIPEIGNMLLPMHIPVFLCAMICGWQYGVSVGFILPLLRGWIFGAPPFFPNGLGMAFELATYGLIAGLLYVNSKKDLFAIYRSLIIAMLAGRAVWGVARVVMLGLGNIPFSFQMFLAGAFLNAIPGLIIQLILIPAILKSGIEKLLYK